MRVFLKTVLLISCFSTGIIIEERLIAQPSTQTHDSVTGAWRVTASVNGHLYMIVRGAKPCFLLWEFWKGERVMRSEVEGVR